MNIIQDINDMFPVDAEFNQIYQDMLNAGQEFSKSKNIAILGLARNINSKSRYVFRKLRLLRECFNDNSAVYIYENDSIDGTPETIRSIIDQDHYTNKFYLWSEKLKTKSMPISKSQIRTTNMANARNKCFSMIQNYSEIDFVIVIDLDFIDFSINGLMNSFGWIANNNSISAICGNSYIKIPNKHKHEYHNYDSFAFRLNYWKDREMSWFPFWNLPIGSCPIAVFSGFGGSCIYKSKLYEPLYSGEDCEHVMLHQKLKNKYDNFKLFYNPSQIMLMN